MKNVTLGLSYGSQRTEPVKLVGLTMFHQIYNFFALCPESTFFDVSVLTDDASISLRLILIL